MASDLARIRASFRDASKGNLIALANVGVTTADGWADATEEMNRRGLTPKQTTAVFWHRQAQRRAFDKTGRLVGPLALYWTGNKAQITNLHR